MKICYALINSDSNIKNYMIENFELNDIRIISNEDLVDVQLNDRDKYLDDFVILKFLKQVYLYCIKNNFDSCIFNFGNGFFFNILKIKKIINEFNLKNKLFSFRISKAHGLYWNQEPKLPFIDKHFIIMNINEIEKNNFFSNRLINYSYSKGSFLDNSILSSFIEFSLERDQICNHYFAEDLYNEYGENEYLNPLKFQICEKTSFVTYYKSQKKYDSIFYKNLEKNFMSNHTQNVKNTSCYTYKKKLGNFKFLRFAKNLILPKYRELSHNEKRSKK